MTVSGNPPEFCGQSKEGEGHSVTLTEKSGHLAWCALVALALARQNGDALSPAQENLFLIRQLGVSAKLASKLNYLWRSCTGELSEQNDLFRLTYALETAKDMSWNYRLLNDREWSGRYAVALNAGVNGIYLSRTNLDAAFDDGGRQINPLLTRLTGNVAGVVKLFNRCGWQADSVQDTTLPHHFMLVASRDA
jgi:hypothetical protein